MQLLFVVMYWTSSLRDVSQIKSNIYQINNIRYCTS